MSKMRQSLYLAASVVALATAAQAETPFNFNTTPGKLPKTVVPSAYKIDITPDLEKLTLTGSEAINITATEAVPSITLNQAGLHLISATLEDKSAATITTDEKAQTATLTFPKPVAKGKHTLRISYTGPIPQTPNGIYYDDYKTPAGASKRMLVTQFEVADARRMFPGWDEPAFKATFQLSVTLPKDLAVVSNMPAVASKTDGALKHVAFAVSPRMSTYLLALVAGDMASVNGAAAGTQMHAFAPSGEEDQAKYALSVEEAVLPYYNEYFGVKFPLPKLDLIAIPGNYEAGAMENWGAVTFIDNAMLFDPANSSQSTKEEIHLVVAHEMAHQWSGDLVTMGWWDNIWLNEGFATWMELKATDHFNPAWETWPRQHGDRERAMAQDAQPTTHPIQQVIRDESEANSAFDGISYQKGGLVIRMIEDWITPDVFRDGMRHYMNAHKFSNATSADLWAALSTAAHRDVTKVAASYTEQPGIPLVKVARDCKGGVGSVTLTQGRFTIHDPNPKAETWTIPVTLGAPGGKTQRVLLGAAPEVIKLSSCDAPIKANWGEAGYYRVQYDAASLKALAGVLNKLAPVDQANLLGDEFALYEAGSAPLSDYLDLAATTSGATNIAVWQDTLGHLATIDRALQGAPEQAAFRAWAVKLLTPEFARLGWDAKPHESFLDTLLRPGMIAALGRADDQAVIAEATKRFNAFLTNPAALPPELRQPVLDIVGHHADQKIYDTLKQLGLKATGTEEKLRYFGAMASATDPKLMEQTVAFATSGAVPNGRITMMIFQASVASGQAELLYKMVHPHEADFAARMPPDGMGPSVLIAAAAGSSDPAMAKTLLGEPSSQKTQGAKIWAHRVAGMINTSAELRAKTAPAVSGWLKAHG